jgi:predicted phosphate transport protein (TIGR00153 family)
MSLIPQEGKFFDYFEQLADKIQEGGILFAEILAQFEYSEEKLARLKEVENQADEITHNIYRKLHQTFITPLDREDIYSLANKMDSVLDMIEAAAVRMHIYKVKQVAPELKELAAILNNSISSVKRIAYLLRQNKKNISEIKEICIKINSLENEADYVLRQSMARLFEQEKNPLELLKWKEIFERIEAATDVCEDVSNVVEGIVLKHG